MIFVVVGAQRSGTNLLREILNTHERIAMLGEIFSPSAAPAHWANFLWAREPAAPLATREQAEALLDRYFSFVRERIANHWAAGLKRRSDRIGVDIKYNQLRAVAPAGWGAGTPFLLAYFAARDVKLVHLVRSNVVHAALSALIAERRNFWHNYDGASIDCSYRVEPVELLARARSIVCERARFLACAGGSPIVTSYYDDLVRDIERAGSGGIIAEGPGALADIAREFGVPFQFRYDGRLKRAIDIPYSRLLSNHTELIGALGASEFSHLAESLNE